MSNQQIITKDKYGQPILLEDIQKVCNEYNLGRIKQKISLLGGSTNTNIYLETLKGKFVLRYITFPVSKERIFYIEDTVKCLKKVNLPVQSTIRNKMGDCYFIDKNRMVQVFPFIEGSKFSFLPNQIKSFGKTLSQFHHTLSDRIQGPQPGYKNHPSEENLEKKLKNLYKKRNRISKTALSRVESLYYHVNQQWAKESIDHLPQSIIHDDWHPWNLIYDNQEQVSCILDLDGIQREIRLYDVAYGLYHIYMNASSHDKKAYADLFVEGYSDLIFEEKKLLPLFVAKVGLFFVMKSASNIEKQLTDNESFIQFLISEKGKDFFE
ncbi:phosphotransferase [Terrilactibacillus laevilacticus]|uniref:Phosphotransferase n=1 Tax=Terrilactibacillus laevilacticus TaxID=1380157 RepID=A0ABW5PN96_9BACI|nr:phosphotransferase [Terrilactibacillus laevilacticus]